MNTADRNRLVAELAPRLPAGWRVFVEPTPLAAVMVLPPTAMGRTTPAVPWPGPGSPPRGLSLCRILMTDRFDRRFGAPGRAILVIGLPGPRRRMHRVSEEIAFRGRGWAVAAAEIMAAEAARLSGLRR